MQTLLATYTAAANGNLTTTNTYGMMPTAAILMTADGSLAISPSDKFLAAAELWRTSNLPLP